MKNLKRLGLLAVATMAVAALVGTASASAASFTAGATGATITEETLEDHVFTVTGSNAECETIAFAGVTEGSASGGLGFTTTSQKVTPSYSNCTAFGFGATVTNNCYYTFNANGTMGILPSSGTSCGITITVHNVFVTCVVHIKAQFLGGIGYASSLGEWIAVFNASGVHFEVTESSGLCPLTKGTHTSGSYTGKSEVGANGTSVQFDA